MIGHNTPTMVDRGARRLISGFAAQDMQRVMSAARADALKAERATLIPQCHEAIRAMDFAALGVLSVRLGEIQSELTRLCA